MPATYLSSGKRQPIPDSAEGLAKVLESNSLTSFEIRIKNDLPLELLRKASVIQVKQRIKNSLTPDKNIIQAVDALDEAHASLNLISERFSTWYSQITGNPRTKIELILSEKEFPSQLLFLRDHYLETAKLVSLLSEYIDSEAPLIFPLIVELLGTQLAARFVASAGSLSKLARMPSSTVQLLGAEKALFRHISDGSPPPKHGFLYQHPLIKKALKKDKGRLSRKLAAKVAIASKVDFYKEKHE